MRYEAQRKRIVEIGRLMFSRWLTNAAGGNIAVRVDEDLMLVTPSGSGARMLWQVAPEDLILVRISDGAVVDGRHRPSRETQMHAGVLRRLSFLNATIHAHPRHALVFAMAGVEIPVAIESSIRVGKVPVVGSFARSGSEELHEQAVELIASQALAKQAGYVACLLPAHGVLTAGTSLEEAYDTLERVETAAYCILGAAALQANPYLQTRQIANYLVRLGEETASTAESE